jgi:hypothetical protein
MTTTAFKIDLMEPAIGMNSVDEPENNTNHDQDHRHVN